MVKKNENSDVMIFESLNYKFLVLGLLLIAGGFTAMYLENEVYGIISLYISPVVIMAGYIIIIFSILVHPSKDKSRGKNNGS